MRKLDLDKAFILLILGFSLLAAGLMIFSVYWVYLILTGAK